MEIFFIMEMFRIHRGGKLESSFEKLSITVEILDSEGFNSHAFVGLLS